MMIGRRALGVVALHRARYTEAAEALQASLKLYDRETHLPLAYAQGYDHAEICAVFLSFAQWISGDLAAARKMSAYSVSHSRDINHMHSLCQALVFRGMLGVLARDKGAMALASVEAEEIGARYDFAAMFGAGKFFGAASRLLSQQAPLTSAEIDELLGAHELFVAANPYNYGSLAGAVIAEIMLRAARPEDCATELKRAEELQEKTGEIWIAPEIMRLRACLADAKGDGSGAVAARREALGMAEKSGALVFALRIACDIAEAEPSEGAHSRVVDIMSRMPSLDGGWDVTRAQAVEACSVTA